MGLLWNYRLLDLDFLVFLEDFELVLPLEVFEDFLGRLISCPGLILSGFLSAGLAFFRSSTEIPLARAIRSRLSPLLTSCLRGLVYVVCFFLELRVVVLSFFVSRLAGELFVI